MNIRFLLGGVISSPLLAVWLAALVLSLILLKRGGGRPARFLVTGSIFMLASTVIAGSSDAIMNYVIQNGSPALSVGQTVSYVTWASGLVALPGIICLFDGVWKKFNQKAEPVINE